MPFWRRNLAKRGPAGSLCISVTFQVAGPHFGDPAAQIWQKRVLQPVRLEFHTFSSRWSPFWGSCSPNLAKRGPAACSFGVPYFSFSFSSCRAPFCAAGVPDPPKRGPAASDFRFLPFSLCWTPFPAVSGRDLQKGAPQPDIKRAATWFFSVPLLG